MVDALLALMVLLLAVVAIWSVATALVEKRRESMFIEKEWQGREFRPMSEMHRY